MHDFVVEELEDLGWSASRIRAALVREGWLSAEKALDRLHRVAVCIAKIIGLGFRYVTGLLLSSEVKTNVSEQDEYDSQLFMG